MIFLVSVCLTVSVTACSSHDNVNEPIDSQNQSSITEKVPTSSESDYEEPDANDIESVRDILHNYLDWSWGYRKYSHELFFDKIIELNGIEFYAFKVYSVAGEYSRTFAISVNEELVYLFDEQTDEWLEDANPDPWPGW